MTAECGCCVKFKCQRDECNNPVWRTISRARQGRRQFCSTTCSTQVINGEKRSRIAVKCAQCGGTVEKKLSRIKTYARAFCNKTCMYIFMAKEKHEREERERRAQENPVIQMLYCSAHAAPTSHRKVQGVFPVVWECAETFERSGKECKKRRDGAKESIMAGIA